MSKIRKVTPETIEKALTVPCRVLAGYAPNIFAEYYTALVFAEQNCGGKKDKEKAASQLEELASIFLIERNRERRFAVFYTLGEQYEKQRSTEYGKFLWKVHRRFYREVIEYCPRYKN